jgi:uncharacterized protein YbbK (DUF523 family)
MVRVLVSACLLGEAVRHDGRDARCAHPVLERWAREGRLVALCPEVAGGLGVPRPPAELQGGDGHAVLQGSARVVTRDGDDVTEAYRRGAAQALDAARAAGARVAILKDGSPSCGTRTIHDGRFAGTTRPGRGVTAALLEAAGLRVFSEQELDAARAYLERLEADTAEPALTEGADRDGPVRA